MSAAAAAATPGSPTAGTTPEEREASVRAILRRKEDEVKEMLAPEKEMNGEFAGMVHRVCVFFLQRLFVLSGGDIRKNLQKHSLSWL